MLALAQLSLSDTKARVAIPLPPLAASPLRCPICGSPSREALAFACGASYREELPCAEPPPEVLAAVLRAWCRRQGFYRAAAILRRLSRHRPPPPAGNGSPVRILQRGVARDASLLEVLEHLPAPIERRVRQTLECAIWP